MKHFIFLIVVSSIWLTSCTINSHVMLKTPRDFVFDEIPENVANEYEIAPGDQLSFRLIPNGGFSLLDFKSMGNRDVNQRGVGVISYLVRPNGMADLPILGKVDLTGLSIVEAQDSLVSMYGEYYVDPFVMLEVANKRVVVFNGTGSNSQVVTLSQNSVTLMELLAQVGGISGDSKANTIKVIRRVEGKELREVYKVDLSKIENLPVGEMIILADDIVYVEPNPRIAREILQDINPVVSLLTTSVLFYATIRNLTNQ